MTLLVDAAPLVALADEREPAREEILDLMRSEKEGLFIPAPVTAEIDYLLGRRFGAPATARLPRGPRAAPRRTAAAGRDVHAPPADRPRKR